MTRYCIFLFYFNFFHYNFLGIYQGNILSKFLFIFVNVLIVLKEAASSHKILVVINCYAHGYVNKRQAEFENGGRLKLDIMNAFCTSRVW
jgi:hypothetical protein